MTKHLAIFNGGAIEKILSGEKTVDARLSLERIQPFGQIKKGDLILLKQSGGDIFGQVRVDGVLFYEGINIEAIAVFRKEYSKELCVDDDFWRDKANSKYVSIIFLKDPHRYVAPVKVKKSDRRPWVVLE